MPETSFNRSPANVSTTLHEPSKLYEDSKFASSHHSNIEVGSHTSPQPPKKRTYIQTLKVFNGTLTQESIFKIFVRPIAFLILPPVIWATLVMSVTIGFLVAISSNFASAFNEVYGFAPYQSGLCFVAGIVGSLLGIFGGGWFSDWTANILTKRNNGIREPEMRLPSITLGLIASPLALTLYGVGIQQKLHWMVPTLGLGLCEFYLSDFLITYQLTRPVSFAITQATNVSLVYTIDAYRPVAGEIVVTQLGFKGKSYTSYSAWTKNNQ